MQPEIIDSRHKNIKQNTKEKSVLILHNPMFKGTVNVILRDPFTKMEMSENRCKNTWKVFNPDNFSNLSCKQEMSKLVNL